MERHPSTHSEKPSFVQRIIPAATIGMLLALIPAAFGQHAGGGHSGNFGGGHLGDSPAGVFTGESLRLLPSEDSPVLLRAALAALRE